MSIASISTRVLLHSLDTWDQTHIYGESPLSLKNISWSNDGKYLLQVNAKGLVEILTINEKELRVLQHVPCKDTCAAIFDREGHRHMAVGSLSGQVLIWDTKSKNIRKSFVTPAVESPVKFLDFNARNNWVASSLENGETVVYGLTTNREVSVIKIPQSKSVSAMHFHDHYCNIIGLASDEGSLLLKDIVAKKDRLFLERVHSSPVSDFVFGRNHPHFLVTCGYDRVFHLYDMKSAKCLSKVQTKQSLTCIDINTKNEVALGTKKGNILIYDLRNHDHPVKVLTDHNSEIKRVLFRPLVNKISTDGSLKDIQSPLLRHYSNRSERSDTTDYFNMTDLPFDKRKFRPEDNTTDANEGKEDGVVEKNDSFLAMMGLADFSDPRQEVPEKSYENTSLSTLENSDPKHLYPSRLIGDKNSINFIFSAKSSTPLTDRVDSVSTPSPIARSARPRNPLDENANKENQNQILGNGQRVMEKHSSNDSVNNVMAALGNELKDLIKYSVAELTDEFRSSHLQMGMALTKQKLFLETEINALGEKILDIQRVQNVLLEENRRLLLEVEILKSSSKFNS